MRQLYSLHNVSAYASMRRWGKSLPGRALTYFTLFCLNLSFIPAAYAQEDEPYFGLEEPIEYNSLSSLDVTSSQLGLDGPFSFGMGYGSLDRYSVNAQYTKEIDEDLAMSVLAEYGEEMYRLGATIGFSVLEHGLAKVSAERFSQLLPFEFDSGNIDEDVAQNAYGIRYQHSLDNNFMQNINFGAYYANAPNVALDPVIFDVSGVAAINYRNIAGATSTGLDMGSSFRLSPSTELSAQVYYDDVRYNTEFTDDSSFDGSGLGGELGVKQLLSDRIAVSAVGSVRELYDVYTVGISWLPPSLPSAEVALLGQRIVSQNETPDNNIVGLQVGFDFGLGGTGPRYALSNLNTSKDIEQWTSTPAVYMEQVLAVAEQYSEFLSGSKVSEDATLTSTGPVITSISETTGPIEGGTELILLGTGFTDAVEVKFGEALGVEMVVVDDTQITVMTPAGEEGVVNVSVATPVGISGAQEENQFKYTLAPLVTGLSPSSGPITAGTSVTITGSGFTGLVGAAAVKFGATNASSYVVNSATQITAVAPAHVAGVVQVIVTGTGGASPSNPPFDQYTYVAVPTITGISPTSGPTTGGTSVVITGANFVGVTAVKFGVNNATSYTVDSATQITATAPAGAAGVIDIRVTAVGGTSAVVAADKYTYIAAPTVTVVAPNAGPLAGGNSVVLTGTSFTGATVVKFGTVNATSFTVNSATKITAVAPAGTAGTVNITVTTVGGTSATSAANQYTYVAAPSVTGLSPSSGPLTAGTSVVITGTNFINVSGVTAVKFGATNASSYVVNSATQITAVAPAHVAGVVQVIVKAAGGASLSNPPSDQYTYVAAPTVTVVAPNAGPLAGGNSVVLTGTNFTGATAVKFGMVAATSFTVNSATKITAVAPAGTAGTVNITVTTVGGTSATSAANQYTYAAAPSITLLTPNTGPTTGVTSVVITGTNFINVSGAAAVKFGTTNASSYVVNSATQITAVAPAGAAGVVDVQVTAAGGTSAIVAADQYTYVAAPTITVISPTSGPTTGGTTVVITGTNFVGVTGAAAVKFGANNATSYTVDSATQITAVAPAGVAGLVNIRVTGTGGTSAIVAADRYTYVAAPTITVVTPNAGPLAGGNSVVLTGTNFVGVTGAAAVKFGGNNATSYTVNSATKITAIAPAGAAGTVDISVTGTGGTSAIVAADQYTYAAVPTITLLAPNTGPTTGGNSVVITGTNFINVSGAAAVKFGTTNASSYVVNSATQITAIAPVRAAGVVDVRVTAAGGTSAIVAADKYTYVVPPPTITLVNPNVGPLTGATTVVITGTNFVGVTGAAAVKFGANNATSYTVNSATQITAIAPAGAAGTVDIRVTGTGGTSAIVAADQYTYIPVPTITSVNPNSGNPAGGDTVTVSGSGFVAGKTQVSFGGVLGTSVNVTSPSALTVTTPAGVGSVNVVVTTPGGQSTDTVIFNYTPTVASLSPTAGPAAGSTLVTISGSGFVNGATTVYFGSDQGVNVNVVNSNNLTVESPSGIGMVNVTVETAGGTSTQTIPYQFVPSISSLSPTQGPVAGGTLVTITGTGFEAGNTMVRFGNSSVSATVSVTSSTSLEVTSPPGSAGSVDVTVTTSGGTSTEYIEFTYDPVPTVIELVPAFGPEAGQTLVNIIGSGFVENNTQVYFGAAQGTNVNVTSPNTLTVTSPAGTGPVNVTVETPGGISTQTVIYTYTPTVSSLSPTSGPAAGSTLVTVSGSGFINGATTVNFGTAQGTNVNVTGPNSLTVFSPPGIGAVNVTVETAGGISTQIVPYNYVPSINNVSPIVGPLTGGELVIISGTGFETGTTVNFGSNSIVANVISSTQLTVRSPAGSSGSVPLSVTTAGGTSTESFTFTFEGPPTVSGLTPNTGPVHGGTSVTITGTNFVGASAVNFGDTPATFTYVSPTQIIATSPSHVEGAVFVTVTTPVGTSATSINSEFVYNPLVSITVTPGNSSIGMDTITSFVATGIYLNGETKDLTSQVAWSSQNSQIASVNSQGYVQGVNAGTTTIIAQDSIFAPKSDPIIVGTTEVTVVSLPNSSSSSSLESTRAMNTPIQAMRKIATPKIVEPLVVTLEVAEHILIVGESMPVYAIAAYGDVTQNIADWVSWSSLDHNIAVIDNEGNITAIAPGETEIIANFVDMTQVITIKVVSE
ncbi:MAG: IPT/TIG domain-containing protein [Legionellales bacterium]|jgi:hypothetical protein